MQSELARKSNNNDSVRYKTIRGQISEFGYAGLPTTWAFAGDSPISDSNWGHLIWFFHATDPVEP